MGNAEAARVGVDVGGTFTDLATVIGGELRVAKVPSTPDDQSVGVADALRGAQLAGPVILAHGMTVATNALLERRGARTALVTNEGFADVIEIGRQTRAALYDPSARRPPPLVPRELRFTVRGRVGPTGVLEPLDEDSSAATVAALVAADVDAVAVCLLFAFVDPSHERAVGEAIRTALPDAHVSLSSDVLPEFREYERTSTTVADAFLGPELVRYLRRLVERVTPIGVENVYVMQSSGGVLSVKGAIAQPAGCVLSGPAGGVVGAAAAARALGFEDVLSLDIGGTSADVAAIVGGESVTSTERQVAGVDIRLPMIDVHTISAGGGSIVWVDDGGALRVGPRSAGAVPGPAGYDRGGTRATVTDANLLLGYLPDGGELGASVRLSAARAEEALAAVGERCDMSATEVAAGALRLTDDAIVQALRHVTVARGLDPRGFALMAFGGAGGLHACRAAAELGVDTVIVPPAAGVLSALGLALADLRQDAARSALAPLDEVDPGELDAAFAELEADLLDRLPGAQLRRRADLRYRRQAHELTIEADDPSALAERFHAAHASRHGYAMADQPVELVTLRVTATEGARRAEALAPPAASGDVHVRRATFDGRALDVDAHVRPPAGRDIAGPAIVEYPDSTCVVPDGWRGEVHASGALVLGRGA